MNLAQIAKILGTRGLMPSPKNETVTPNPVAAIKELKKGKVTFKNDDGANIHQVIGKVSFDNAKLKENFESFMEELKKVKPQGSKGTYVKAIYLTSAMGPSVKVEVTA